MTDFIQTLRDLQERTSKPGLLGIAGMARERKCAKDLAAYFRSLGRKIYALNLGELVTREESIAIDAANMRVSNVIRASSDVLSAILAINIYEAYMASDKQVLLTEAASAENLPLDRLGATGKDAAAYAAKRSAKLIADINATTRTRIAGAISRAIKERSGVGGASRFIREIVEDMANARATVIASTEMNDAMSEAALRKMKRLKIAYKQLILSSEACEICSSIASNGPVPVDDSFVDLNGDEYERTPIHPTCRCATTGARAPEGEDEDAAA